MVAGTTPVMLVRLMRDPFEVCMAASAQGPGLVRLGGGPVKAYLISHPDFVHHVLVANAQNYHKGSIMDGIRLALGDGLFTSDGPSWRRQREIMQPAFRGRQIQSMAAAIEAVVTNGIAGWAPAIDLLQASTRLNISVTLATLFGTTADGELAARLLRLTDTVFRGMTERVWTFFAPVWVPTPGARAYRRAIGWIVTMTGYSATPAEEMPGHVPGQTAPAPAEAPKPAHPHGEPAGENLARRFVGALHYLVGQEEGDRTATAIDADCGGYLPQKVARGVGLAVAAEKARRTAKRDAPARAEEAAQEASNESAEADAEVVDAEVVAEPVLTDQEAKADSEIPFG